MVNLDYFYQPAFTKPYFDPNRLHEKGSGFSIIEHGTILPYKDVKEDAWGKGGVVDDKGNYVPKSYIAIDGAYTPPPRINFAQFRDRCLPWGIF